MDDKQVGSLYHSLMVEWAFGEDELRDMLREDALDLIRKLVEERNCRRIQCQNFDAHQHPFGERSVSDFNIDPKTWKED